MISVPSTTFKIESAMVLSDASIELAISKAVSATLGVLSSVLNLDV